MEKNVNRNEVSANNVAKFDEMSVFEMHAFTDEDRKVFSLANKEAASLNRTIKTMKEAAIWAIIAPIMERYGFVEAKDLTVSSFKCQIHPKFMKSVEYKEDGQTKKKNVICRVKKMYETETVYLCNENGEKLCKEGKPRTTKQVVLEEDGEKLVKGYKLFQINRWSIEMVCEMLRQSANARKLEVDAAKLANEKAAEKNEKAA